MNKNKYSSDMKKEIDNILEGFHLNEYDLLEVRKKLLNLFSVSGMLPDEVPNLFVNLAQQIHYESAINGLDMTSVTESFNELQEAYKKERSNYR